MGVVAVTVLHRHSVLKGKYLGIGQFDAKRCSELR